MSNSLYDISLKQIDGSVRTLGDYRGKVLLVVNVASKCGLTPQYEGLENCTKTKIPRPGNTGFPRQQLQGARTG